MSWVRVGDLLTRDGNRGKVFLERGQLVGEFTVEVESQCPNPECEEEEYWFADAEVRVEIPVDMVLELLLRGTEDKAPPVGPPSSAPPHKAPPGKKWIVHRFEVSGGLADRFDIPQGWWRDGSNYLCHWELVNEKGAK